MTSIKSISFGIEDLKNLSIAQRIKPKMGLSSLIGLIIKEWLDTQSNSILTPTEMKELAERMVKALARLE